MNKLLFIFLTGTSMSFGQTLSVGSNSSININSNSSLSVDGLELAPNEAYTISGPNTLTVLTRPLLWVTIQVSVESTNYPLVIRQTKVDCLV